MAYSKYARKPQLWLSERVKVSDPSRTTHYRARAPWEWKLRLAIHKRIVANFYFKEIVIETYLVLGDLVAIFLAVNDLRFDWWVVCSVLLFSCSESLHTVSNLCRGLCKIPSWLSGPTGLKTDGAKRLLKSVPREKNRGRFLQRRRNREHQPFAILVYHCEFPHPNNIRSIECNFSFPFVDR